MALTSIHLHDSPVLLTLFCYALSCLVILFTDRFALPKRERRKHRPPTRPKDHVIEALARLPVIFLVFAGFFAISWRPLYAGAGTMSFFIIFTAISRAKFKFIREPLVFSDIALVADVFKYKSIFYANSLNIVFWTVAFLYVFGVSGLYMYFEPDLIPDRHWFIWAVIMLAIADVPWLLLFYGPVNRLTADMVRKIVGKPSARVSTIRFGTFTSVVFHFIMWLGARREKIVSELQERFFAAVQDLIGHDADNKAPLVIVWQSESFLDMRRLGVDTLALPTMDRLQKRASQWGLLATVFEGGYTLRTEFAVLSGLLPDDLHVDASYPYLRASHYTDVVWPTKLKNAGWSTHFIHPYDRTFFLRHKAMPQLGFEKMTMLDEFAHDVARDGPYVSDATLTEKVIEQVEAQTDAKGSLLFVASMANHGPWEPGRCGELTDPVSIYLEILQQSDAALGTLVDHLDALDRPVWLVFYGDHAPLLKSFADPFPDPRTDYFIVPLGSVRNARGSSVPAQTEEPWNLFEAMLKHANLQKDELQ
ncbi:LTA synthase family protein [Pararhizobium antarcticum]|uniref:Capsular biosynthesis protein n=1 Tax=Pararhizobium antarcticum TaxID=1798805 RepID=A0A657LY04_9HYPH|nr:LTA synthase family protein [Pararhizobium antarcticum]OJF98449.1 capsular biosynthesis protein [Rhizobium sp. 58]OJG01019.1 capsular biosynthesis protein [Pararhizobium antarcticum]